MADDDVRPEADSSEPSPGTPRWVKTSAIAALVLVVLVVIAMLLSGGEHGPGRHSGGLAPPPSTAQPHAPPGGQAP